MLAPNEIVATPLLLHVPVKVRARGRTANTSARVIRSLLAAAAFPSCLRGIAQPVITARRAPAAGAVANVKATVPVLGRTVSVSTVSPVLTR